MERFVQNLKLSLALDLKKIQGEEESYLIVAEKASHLHSQAMKQLKVFIDTYQFKSQDEEILFFKELKPSIHSELIFYCKICDIESRRPVGSIVVIKEYLSDELNHLRYYFEKHKSFYQYCRLKKTNYDNLYFTRNEKYSGVVADAISLSADKDPNFSTPFEFKISKIIANEKLIQYLMLELIKLDNPLDIVNDHHLSLKKIAWPCSKVDLVEIIYGVYYILEKHHVNISIKNLASIAENIFDIKLNDIYRIYTEIRLRKNNRTSFIDKMKDLLLKKMEEVDAK